MEAPKQSHQESCPTLGICAQIFKREKFRQDETTAAQRKLELIANLEQRSHNTLDTRNVNLAIDRQEVN